MFTTNIDSKIEISYLSTEQLSPETRSPGISDRSRVSFNLTPRGDSLQNTQGVTTYYTPYGASASETIGHHTEHHGQRQSGSRQTTKTKANKSRIVLPNATNLRRPI